VLRTSSGFRRDDELLSISADAGYTGADKRISASKMKHGHIAAKRDGQSHAGRRMEGSDTLRGIPQGSRAYEGGPSLSAERYLISARSRQIDGPRHLLLHGSSSIARRNRGKRAMALVSLRHVDVV